MSGKMESHVEPKVSIIVPVYNGENHIAHTIESVLNQTFSRYEIIIIDDGSTDGTAEAIKRFRDKRIRYVYQANQGPSVAKNRALLLAKGKYIAFLDSDDIWVSDKLSRQLEMFDNNPSLGLVFGGGDIVTSDGEVLTQVRYTRRHVEKALEEMLSRCFIYTPSLVMVRKKCFHEIGFFDKDLWFSDWEIYVRIIKKYRVGYIDARLIDYKQTGAGLTNALDKHNNYRMKILDKIWSDKSLLIRYPLIRANAYFKSAMELTRSNFKNSDTKNSKKYSKIAILNRPWCMEAWRYFLYSMLGISRYKKLRSFKRKIFCYLFHVETL